jgi:hypothetical protein
MGVSFTYSQEMLAILLGFVLPPFCTLQPARSRRCRADLRLPSFPQHHVSVSYATEHRCGVVVRGPGLTDAVSSTDPLKDNLPLLHAEPLDDSLEVRSLLCWHSPFS